MSYPVTEKVTTKLFSGASEFFESSLRSDGKMWCSKHHIEHAGKNVYSILINSYLYDCTGEDKFFNRALKRAEYTAKLLVKDSDTDAFVFWPGRLKKGNMSNSAIDSGSCSDTLADFLYRYKNNISEETYDMIWVAVEKNCDTYLVEAALGKAHTNQRLWAATGLASAYRINQKKEWKQVVLESVEMSISEFKEDGVIPYVTDFHDTRNSIGIVDTTPYYHSRHIAFILHCWECLGQLSEEDVSQLLPAMEFLVGMYNEDGRKNINFETKRWYFLSSYEIASNSYDIFALLFFYQQTQNDFFNEYASRALDEMMEHQFDEGGVYDSHDGQINFQCPFFWNSHLGWLARALGKFDFNFSPEHNNKSLFFSSIGAMKVVRDNYACTTRGAKRPMDARWGPRAGGGSLIYWGTRENDFHNKLSYREWSRFAPLNFISQGRPFQGVFDLLDKQSLRAMLYYLKVEIKAMHLKAATLRLWDVLKKLTYSNSIASSHLYPEPLVVSQDDDHIHYKSGLSKHDGTVVDDVSIDRIYSFQNNHVKVKERLVSSGDIGKLFYFLHPDIENLKVVTDVNWKRRRRKITFAKGAKTITVSYRLSVQN